MIRTRPSGGSRQAAPAGVYDTEQWDAGPLACNFAFVTADLCARLRRCDIDGATRASEHQPVLLELD